MEPIFDEPRWHWVLQESESKYAFHNCLTYILKPGTFEVEKVDEIYLSPPMETFKYLKSFVPNMEVEHSRYTILIMRGRAYVELQQLEHDKKKDKVDHPPSGSKDIADAVCGAYYTMLHRSSTWRGDMLGVPGQLGSGRFSGERSSLGDRV